MDVEDLHPLRAARLLDIAPQLSCLPQCCLGKPRSRLRDAIRYSLLEEIDELLHEDGFEKGSVKIPENEAQVDEATGKLKADEDPFLIAGYGMNAFFSVQNKLVKMFLFITVVMLPVMMIYAFNDEQGVGELP